MPCRMRSENNTLVLSTCLQTCYCGELKQQRRRRHRERQKSDRFRLAKQQLWACITPFLYISLQSLHDCDVKLSNFTLLENVSTRKRLSSFFPELRLWSPFSIRKIFQHLTNWARYNKHDEAWSSAYSLLKWRFRNRRRPCCLSSLTVSSDVSPQGNILLPELVTAAVSQSFLITTYKVDTSLTIWKKD